MKSQQKKIKPRLNGKFIPEGDERLSRRVVGFRLPESLDEAFHEYLERNNLNKREVLTAWVKEKLSESQNSAI